MCRRSNDVPKDPVKVEEIQLEDDKEAAADPPKVTPLSGAPESVCQLLLCCTVVKQK